jgi:acetyl esterase/lipase
VKDQAYKEINGVALGGDFYVPRKAKAPMPAVVVVHGGGWSRRAGDMEAIAKDLASSGFFTYNITYRLAPKDHFPSPVDDVRDAIRFLRNEAPRLGIDVNRMAGWGYSAGANLILLAGLDGKEGLKAIVAGGTPADLTQWPNSDLVKGFMGSEIGRDRKAWEAASPKNQVSANSPPTFFYHGEWDDIVPIEQLRQMEEAYRAKKVPFETHIVPYQGHLWVYFFSQESADLGVNFLKRKLNQPTSSKKSSE